MKRTLKAVLIGTTVFGSTVAAAASLGLESASLGAGDVVVAPCTEDASIDYDTVYDGAAKAYVVDAVTIAGLEEGCSGHDVAVTLELTGQEPLEITDTLPALGTDDEHHLDVDPAVAAEAIVHVAAVIAG